MKRVGGTSPAQIYTALRGVGFTIHDAAIMTAISGAESGWNPKAVGDVNLETKKWGPSVGLFQIRTLKAQTGTGGYRDRAVAGGDLYTQAAAARLVYNAQGFGAWSTYKSGSYRKFLGQTSHLDAEQHGQGGATPRGIGLGAAAGGTVGKPKPKKRPKLVGSGAPAFSSPTPDTYSSGGGGGVGGGTTTVENAGFLSPGVFPGGVLDPLNWAGSILGNPAGSAAEGAWNVIQPFAVTAMFALGGIALIVVGLAVTASPARQRIQSEVQDAAGQAASVAAVAA